jgi:hypothetical protein
MSFADAAMTGIISGLFTATFLTLQTYFLNRYVIKPLDKRLTRLEDWLKNKIPSNGKSDPK